MNNIVFGDSEMVYYETVAGGAGAVRHYSGTAFTADTIENSLSVLISRVSALRVFTVYTYIYIYNILMLDVL